MHYFTQTLNILTDLPGNHWFLITNKILKISLKHLFKKQQQQNKIKKNTMKMIVKMLQVKFLQIKILLKHHFNII